MADFRLLDCSTIHITPNDRKLLESGSHPAFYGHYEYGAIVWVPHKNDINDNLPEWKETGWSEAFINLIRYAAEHDFERLQLDSDGDEIEGLPRFGDFSEEPLKDEDSEGSDPSKPPID